MYVFPCEVTNVFVVLGPSPTHLATMQGVLARMETGIQQEMS